MTYEEFESKLKPKSVIITENRVPLVIKQIEGNMIITQSTPPGEDVELRVTKELTFYHICNAENKLPEAWRLLTKEEFVEEFI